MLTKITVTSLIHPSRFISPVDGQHYIVPQWIPISKDFDFDKHLIWEKPVFGQPKLLAEVKASRGTTVYQITELKGKISCTCGAFKYRGADCKHIQQFKLEALIKR